MTASSIDFSPCRVQLIGLPLLSIKNITASNPGSLVNASRPVVAKIKGVSRNLFGTPDRDEMTKLYQQESERQHSYVLKRYNFDTKTSKPTYDKELQPTDKIHRNQTTTCPAFQPTNFPTIIRQELVQHEQRLHDEEHNLNRSSLEFNTPIDKIPKETKSCSEVSHRCLAHTLSPSPAVERQKPYTRQTLLKESFNIRKNKIRRMKDGKECNEKIIFLENNQTSHRNVEVLQLPQLPKNTCEVKNNGNKSPTYNDVSELEQGQVGLDRSTANSFNENCTTFSLQLVVSPHNVS